MLNKNIYKEILLNAPFAYSYNQLIRNKDGFAINFKYLDINNQFEKLLGIKRDKIINKNYLEIFPNNELKELERIDFYNKVCMGKNNLKLEFYSELLKKWLKIEISHDKKDYFILFIRDISDKKSNFYLTDLEKRKVNLFKNMNDLIFVLDSNFVFKEFHVPNNKKLFLHPKDFLGKKISNISFPEPALNSIVKTLNNVKNGKKLEQIEYYIYLNKKIEWFDARISIISGTEEDPEFLCVIRDITKLKETEQRIKNLSMKDPLTNTFNRRYMFEKLIKLEKKFKKSKETFSIIILDLDYFKKINDNFGHLAGDYILKEFTKIVQSNISSDDLLGRYGGEEFIIIMLKCDKEIAYKKMKIILDKVKSKKFIFNKNNIYLTFSAGIIDNKEYKLKKFQLDKLMDFADKKLYRAKKQGRSKICSETI